MNSAHFGRAESPRPDPPPQLTPSATCKFIYDAADLLEMKSAYTPKLFPPALMIKEIYFAIRAENRLFFFPPLLFKYCEWGLLKRREERAIEKERERGTEVFLVESLE